MNDLTYQKVAKIIAEILGIDRDKITPESRLDEDLGMDSLYSLELFSELENEFDIKISGKVSSSLYTVQQIVDFLEENEA